MSVLRVCAFAKCFSRRTLLEKCALRGYFADSCRLSASFRSGAVRRISQKPLQLQRANASFAIPKTDNARKRVLEQSQLFEVLEARIQQLQTDMVFEVQHAEVQLVKDGSLGRGVSSSRGSKTSKSKDKAVISKSGAKGTTKEKEQPTLKKQPKNKAVISKSGAKGTEKEKEKATLQKQQKVKQTTERKPTAKSKGSKSTSQIQPSTTYKTISASKANKTTAAVKTSTGGTELSDATHAMVSPKATSTAATELKASTENVSNSNIQRHADKEPRQTVDDAQSTEMSLAKVEELGRRLVAKQEMSSSVPEHPQEDTEGTASSDLLLSIRNYLEASVHTGNIERANCFLLVRHRGVKRRKILNTEIYNTLMKVWAKKGLLNSMDRMFKMVEESGSKPNLVSYAAALECIGRNPGCSPKYSKRYLSQMEQQGLSLDDLWSQHLSRQEEREMVLKAIHVVHPDYQPRKPTLNDGYTPLTQDFYTQRKNHHYPKLDLTQEQLIQGFKRQLEVEKASTITINSVEATKPVTENMMKMRKLLEELHVKWRKALLQSLKEMKIKSNSKVSDKRLNLYPYLCLLKDEEYVDIMLQSISNVPPSGKSLRMLAEELGSSVFTKFSLQQKQNNQMVANLSNIYSNYTELLAKDTKESTELPREKWCNLEMEKLSGAFLQEDETHWSLRATLELGTCMVDMLMSLKINSDILNPAQDGKHIPILYHMYTFLDVRQIGHIKIHPILAQMQQEAMLTTLTFDSHVMPMLCPPVPWTSVKSGAYLLTPYKLMRSGDGATQHKELLEKCQNLNAILDSLNQLSSCPWRINKPVLDVIIPIFNDQGNKKLDIPPPPQESPKLPHVNLKELLASDKAQMKKDLMNDRKKSREMYSLRIDALYKLSIANHLRDEIFWFPHNLDFRGRTYPCPPYFNHLVSDMTRGVLEFAEGKPLGPKGLDWLKIHLVNLTGLKKRNSLQERLEYANTLMEDILDSADNPLNGKKWWMEAEDPWQALACCMEIAKAVRSPDSTQFISHFPVHQDGSCNGLQHYAALGRDMIGARSVNLMPCTLPQDVYHEVALQVEELRAKDAKNGTKIAKILQGFINRKVVKQTVMTVVYGVTRYGGRLQLQKRLEEIDEFPEEHVWDASYYLVKQVFAALKEMFEGTREIQDWLTQSAKLISQSGHAVQWVTPLGLPVVQPYHRTRCYMIKSTLQQFSIRLKNDADRLPNTMKQKNAFAPNFIHSLDSTHMMLTSLYCYSAGLTFVSVHDCYWTHALTVDTMNKICREQFVNLHSQPILEDLSKFLLLQYNDPSLNEGSNKKSREYKTMMQLLAKVPKTGDFDINHVLESTYFFS